MKVDELHTFDAENWKALETQFSVFSTPVFNFVTENKGSLTEAEEIYIKAFIYYSQLLELRGFKHASKGEDLVYSFSRKLWIKALGKRNVDTDFVLHRRSFYDMEDAFHEIESINERSEKTTKKLAEIGEPARTLVMEHIGKLTDLNLVGARLGYGSEERAFAQIAKSLRKLIRITETKTFELDDTTFEALVKYVLNGEHNEEIEGSEEKKVAITMISRVVAMIRSYISRNQRIAKLKEIQDRVHPDVQTVLKKSSPSAVKNNKKMKPTAVYFISAGVAVLVSILSAFGFTSLQNQSHAPEPEATEAGVDSLTVVEEVVAVIPEKKTQASAFALTNDGLFITSAKVENGKHCELYNSDDGSRLKGKVVYTDTIQNISLLKCDLNARMQIPYMLAPYDLKIAQKMYSVGFTQDVFQYNEGTVNSAKPDGNTQVYLESASQGSPIISEKGQILGMVLDKNEGESRYPVLNISKIKELIYKYESYSGEKVQLTSRNGLFYNERTEQVEKLKPFIYQIKDI